MHPVHEPHVVHPEMTKRAMNPWLQTGNLQEVTSIVHLLDVTSLCTHRSCLVVYIQYMKAI